MNGVKPIKDSTRLLCKVLFNKMCFKYFVETLKPKQEKTKYIPLQNIICEPETFNLQRCFYHTQILKIDKTQKVPYVELQKDKFILGDEEYMKYEHISHIRRLSSHMVIVYVFARIDRLNGTLHFEDNPAAIIFTFEKPVSNKFINTLLKYIISYKKYNSFDKTAMTFKSFKIKRVNN